MMAEMTDKDTSGFVCVCTGHDYIEVLRFYFRKKETTTKNNKSPIFHTDVGVGTGNKIAYADLFFVFVFVLLLFFFLT